MLIIIVKCQIPNPQKKQIAKKIKYIKMLIQELVFKLLGRQLLAVCVHRLHL